VTSFKILLKKLKIWNKINFCFVQKFFNIFSTPSEISVMHRFNFPRDLFIVHSTEKLRNNFISTCNASLMIVIINSKFIKIRCCIDSWCNSITIHFIAYFMWIRTWMEIESNSFSSYFVIFIASKFRVTWTIWENSVRRENILRYK
jgi:hypothetical protein